MWTHGGYSGAGNVEGLLGSVKGGRAIVAGNAYPVFDQVRLVLETGPASVFAVNDTGMYLPNIDHWVTLHSDKMRHWRALRKIDSHLGQNFATHAIIEDVSVDYAWINMENHFALSGYFATQIAYLMGFDEIILCGCPGDNSPRYFESSQGRADGYCYQDKGVVSQLELDMKRFPEFKKKVRSVSGYTRELFGGFINGGNSD